MRPEDLPAVRIEAANEWAWCGGRRLRLTPRAFAVLRHLVEHPQRLITKEDFFTVVWRDVIVGEAALASCIRDLRKALADSSRGPRYIETVHRRGFRFVGPVARAGAPADSGPREPPTGVNRPATVPGAAPATPVLVGREAELAWLQVRLARAMSGQRQLVFVTGEPGIGKTALVEAFLLQIGADDQLRVGRGQCVEQYGTGEAYLPVLEALGRLGREAPGEHLVRILKQYAPTWLVQLPALLTDRDLEAVQRRAEGVTRDRMLRELVEALDVLGKDALVVLFLEDLHWSDSATIDLLAMLARRREASRLLVIGTYRPADVAVSAHPLRAVTQELRMHGHCEELLLEFLSLSAVGEYLAARFAGHGFPPELAQVLHRSTDGNPLFLVNTIDYLVGEGQLRETGGRWELTGPLEEIASRTPETLWKMVERQVERLTGDEQAILAVGSVVGAEFSAAVAVADGIDPQEAERRCDSLARRGQFVRSAGVAEWPDGTVAARYAFIHALYQRALYARIPIGHRAGLHLRAGERLERAYGERAGEISGELAMHFERSRDYERAARYHRQAGEHALRKHAHREAADHAMRALHLLEALPDSPECRQQELTLQLMLGAALTATHGYAAPDVARAYERARELCAQVGDTVWLLPVLLGLGRFHQSRGELQIARGLGARLLAIADSTGDTTVRLAGHNAMGIMAFHAGEFESALAHLQQGIHLYDPGAHGPDRSIAFQAAQDPGVSCMVYEAWTHQLLGRPARAAARMREALGLARSLGHLFTAAYACHLAAGFHLYRREYVAVMELEDEALRYSTELGLRIFPLVGVFHRGRTLAERGRGEEALPQMREGLATLRAMGIEIRRPTYLGLIAEVCGAVDRVDEALAALAEALAEADRTAQHYWDAELHRLAGRLTLRSAAAPAISAEQSFRQALEIARRQGARWLELRAATDLSRLWAERGKVSEAHALLSGTVGGFTEGLDTADPAEARSLLHELECRMGRGRARKTGRSRPAAPGADRGS